MNLQGGLEIAAENYRKAADKAEADAKLDKQKASWHSGRASVFRQAAIDFETLAGFAAQENQK